MAKINVEGKEYKVIENLGVQNGCRAKAVETPGGGEQIAVKRGGVWTWWTPIDRIGQGGYIVGM